MVHALSEVHRVLQDNGQLLDLRPRTASAPIHIVSAREHVLAGEAMQAASEHVHTEAADAALTEAGRRGLFVQEHEARFPYFYFWDSPNEMQRYLQEEWEEIFGISEDTWRALRAAWAIADGDASLRMEINLSITRWRKLGSREATVARSALLES